LINLLNNAVKFTPKGGQVFFSAGLLTQEPPQLVFIVRDTGIGIAEADLAKLFQPFVQVDSRLNRQYEGTGLGLALVKRLAELHFRRLLLAMEKLLQAKRPENPAPP
jgi:signal transduction histidine kinase